jgi:MinD-like ATPase involved in chromosome partitioning or flagellar assembly
VEGSCPAIRAGALDQRIFTTAYAGTPFIIVEPDSPASEAFTKIVEKVEAFTEGKLR